VPATSTFYVSEFNSSGTFQNGLTGGGSVSAPVALAVDPSGNVWAANGTGVLTEYSKTFAQVSSNAGYTDNALQGPAGIAFDASGNAWVTGQGGPELSGFTSAGGAVTTAPVYNANGASLTQPTGVAVDAAGSIWVTNSTSSGYLSEFAAGTGAPVATAQTLGSLNAPVQVAVDPSGNVWTANSGDSSVTIFLGLAAPTVTPLVARTQ
jgi:streptogramin lyase